MKVWGGLHVGWVAQGWQLQIPWNLDTFSEEPVLRVFWLKLRIQQKRDNPQYSALMKQILKTLPGSSSFTIEICWSTAIFRYVLRITFSILEGQSSKRFEDLYSKRFADLLMGHCWNFSCRRISKLAVQNPQWFLKVWFWSLTCERSNDKSSFVQFGYQMSKFGSLCVALCQSFSTNNPRNQVQARPTFRKSDRIQTQIRPKFRPTGDRCRPNSSKSDQIQTFRPIRPPQSLQNRVWARFRQNPNLNLDQTQRPSDKFRQIQTKLHTTKTHCMLNSDHNSDQNSNLHVDPTLEQNKIHTQTQIGTILAKQVVIWEKGGATTRRQAHNQETMIWTKQNGAGPWITGQHGYYPKKPQYLFFFEITGIGKNPESSTCLKSLEAGTLQIVCRSSN